MSLRGSRRRWRRPTRERFRVDRAGDWPGDVAECCKIANLPMPVRDFRFHESRLWELDFAWPAFKVGIEIDGGIFRKGGGAHTGGGHKRDLVKGRDAILSGWRVLHYLPEEVTFGLPIEDLAALLKGSPCMEKPTRN